MDHCKEANQPPQTVLEEDCSHMGTPIQRDATLNRPLGSLQTPSTQKGVQPTHRI